ncbi:hypothetical protein MMA231_02455 [Asticcacaulis sp. MM231]|uniref:hypothetical protein n=1 Tax=Asticcacaulis sp. MM231 TaxID=3157666 RepID=UPI0032D59C1D
MTETIASERRADIRDRLIIAAPLAPAFVALLVVAICKPSFIISTLTLAGVALISAIWSLLPLVGNARMRRLKRKYPKE